MKIYLDHNLIVYLRGDKSNNLNERIKESKGSGDVFLFSPAHLEEIAVSYMRDGISKDIIDRDIAFLTDLCGNNSLRPITRDKVVFNTEYPRECYERVLANYENNDLAENIEIYVISDANKNPLGNPKEINNVDPGEIFNHITHIERLLILLRDNGFITQSEAIKCLQSHPNEILRNRFCVLTYSVNTVANWLEKIGYYREKIVKSRSRLHDVSHAIYGKYADVLISNDDKFLKKTRVVYSFLGIPTRVISMEDFIKNGYAE